MIRHQEYTRARLAQTSERLRALIWPETRPLDELLVSEAVDRISFDEAQLLQLRPAELGKRFGPLWATYWFRGRAMVPEEWAGMRVELLWDSSLRVSLLRSPTSPDPEADQGGHEFVYALMPHAGGWREAGVLAEAHLFNAPMRWTSGVEPAASFAAVDDPNLVLDTVKRAEDSEALVLRLYEAHGGRGTARLRLGVPFASATLANGLEEDGDATTLDHDEIVVPYRPHQLLTVKIA